MAKVGIQLFSVVDEMRKDPIKAIEEVVKIGYKNLEVANHNAVNDPGVGFGVSADELNRILDGFGAQVIGAHVAPFDESTAEAVIEYHNAVGNKYIICPSAMFNSYDDTMKQIEHFNKMGKLCAKNGMKYLYHNHIQEFQVFGGKEVMDLIVENTDPDYVGIELDTFWAMRAGKDPVELMKHLGDRLILVHQKDFSKDTDSPVNILETFDPSVPLTREMFAEKRKDIDFCEIGTGTMDIQSIVDEANNLGVEYIILEQDATQKDSSLESIQISMDSFKKYSGIEF